MNESVRNEPSLKYLLYLELLCSFFYLEKGAQFLELPFEAMSVISFTSSASSFP